MFLFVQIEYIINALERYMAWSKSAISLGMLMPFKRFGDVTDDVYLRKWFWTHVDILMVNMLYVAKLLSVFGHSQCILIWLILCQGALDSEWLCEQYSPSPESGTVLTIWSTKSHA